MAKKSGVREKIMMLSTGKTKDGRDTGFFYTTQKNMVMMTGGWWIYGGFMALFYRKFYPKITD